LYYETLYAITLWPYYWPFVGICADEQIERGESWQL
jgi:hypothetical protein